MVFIILLFIYFNGKYGKYGMGARMADAFRRILYRNNNTSK